MYSFFKKTIQRVFYSNPTSLNVVASTSLDENLDTQSINSLSGNIKSSSTASEHKSSFLNSLVKQVTPLIRYCETSPTIKIMTGLVILGGFVAFGAAMAVVAPLAGRPNIKNESEDFFELDNHEGLEPFYLDPNDVAEIADFLFTRNHPDIKELEASLIARLDPTKFIDLGRPIFPNANIAVYSAIPKNRHTGSLMANIVTSPTTEKIITQELGSNEPVSIAELQAMAEISKSPPLHPIFFNEFFNEELTESDWQRIFQNPKAEDFTITNSDNETLLHLAAKNITIGAQAFQKGLDVCNTIDWFTENSDELSPFGVAVNAGNLGVLDFYFQNIPFYISHLQTVVTELTSHRFVGHVNHGQLFTAELQLINYFDLMIKSAKLDILNLMFAEATLFLEPIPDEIPEPLLKQLIEQVSGRFNADIDNILNKDFFETLILSNHGPLFCHLITDEKFKHLSSRAISVWHSLVTREETDVTEFLAGALRYVAVHPEKSAQLEFLFYTNQEILANEILSINSYNITHAEFPLKDFDEKEIAEFTHRWLVTERTLSERFFLLHTNITDFSEEKIFSYAMQAIDCNLNLVFKCFWLRPNLLLNQQYAKPIIEKMCRQDKGWFPLIFKYIFSGKHKAPYYNKDGVQVHEHEADSIFQSLFETLLATKNYGGFFPSDNLHIFKWRDTVKSKILDSITSPSETAETFPTPKQGSENSKIEETELPKINFNWASLGIILSVVSIKFIINYFLNMYDDALKLTAENLFHGLPKRIVDKEDDIELTLLSEEEMIEITAMDGKKFSLPSQRVSTIIEDLISKNNLQSTKQHTSNSYMLDKGKLWNLSVAKLFELNQNLHLALWNTSGKKKLAKNKSPSLSITNNNVPLAGQAGITFNEQLKSFSKKINELLSTIENSFIELLTITNTNESALQNTPIDVFSHMASQFPEHTNARKVLTFYGIFTEETTDFLSQVQNFLATLPPAEEMPTQSAAQIDSYKAQLTVLKEKCKQLQSRSLLNLEAIPEIDEVRNQFDKKLNALFCSVNDFQRDIITLYHHYYKIKHPGMPFPESINAAVFSALANEFNALRDDRKTAQDVPKYSAVVTAFEKFKLKLNQFKEALPKDHAIVTLTSPEAQYFMDTLNALEDEFNKLKSSFPEGKGKEKLSVADCIFFRHKEAPSVGCSSEIRTPVTTAYRGIACK
jgi:hypothetical protein